MHFFACFDGFKSFPDCDPCCSRWCAGFASRKSAALFCKRMFAVSNFLTLFNVSQPSCLSKFVRPCASQVPWWFHVFWIGCTCYVTHVCGIDLTELQVSAGPSFILNSNILYARSKCTLEAERTVGSRILETINPCFKGEGETSNPCLE